MIVVTGAAGFIGSNIARALNVRGRQDILLVDHLKDGHKYRNMVDLAAIDYMDRDTFLQLVEREDRFLKDVEVIFHEGACSNTTLWDGIDMMTVNYEYSKTLLHWCDAQRIPFIYASSAAIYGASNVFTPDVKLESPLNLYGYSKLIFDRYYTRLQDQFKTQVVGLRYFNVYGKGEGHKTTMCSVIRHFYNELLRDNQITIYVCDGYEPGEQRRDFIFIDDVVKLNLWFWENPNLSGIHNCGTGVAASFNEIAQVLIDWYGQGSIVYQPLPKKLKGAYQTYTQADMSEVRRLGYDAPFTSIEQGIVSYVEQLSSPH